METKQDTKRFLFWWIVKLPAFFGGGSKSNFDAACPPPRAPTLHSETSAEAGYCAKGGFKGLYFARENRDLVLPMMPLMLKAAGTD